MATRDYTTLGARVDPAFARRFADAAHADARSVASALRYIAAAYIAQNTNAPVSAGASDPTSTSRGEAGVCEH